jgi:Zn-finger nucleic acid-binding protein
MFAGSRFCARCGAEATREKVDDATPLDCPRCAGPLQALTLGAMSVRECAACGGLWMDPATLQELSDAREEHASVVSTLAARVPANAATPDTVRYIPCPRCAKLMNRVNFAHASGVILDVCKNDGVWFDRGELQRIVSFVEHGGLAVAREHEKEQLAEERRRLAAARAASALTLTGSHGFVARGAPLQRPSSGTSIEQLLLDALGLFIK